ncbi:putative baseplate assembly protein [Actinoplanes sp. DH11]|uniref:putative baseplate assembly protein n=1 Tax=Actinoplanes sp. DH11 TaxID=2857011 RepID=UPI001E55B795|nr:putative baseplate assembly protein [Actinoplanes sp. DH11]
MSGPHHGADRRRARLRRTAWLNGLDYVEVEGDENQPELHVYLLRSLPHGDDRRPFTAANVVIEGGPVGEEITVRGDAEFTRAPDPARDDHAVLHLSRRGGHARYTLRLRATPDAPLPDIDPRYSAVSFTFEAGTVTDVDCLLPPPAATAPPAAVPELSYLAKDYASFRQLLLDRLATTMPAWRERHAADLYLTVLEVFAYEADRLSYAQDAVATEAYLDTARLRRSIRRHVRLVDYPMHEGCNARTWVMLRVSGDPVVRADRIAFLTRPPGVPADRVLLGTEDLERAGRLRPEVFEPLIAARPATVVTGDIVHPRRLARRLLSEPGAAFDQLRARLPDAGALERDDLTTPALLELLAERLTALVRDPGWALRDDDATCRVLRRHGTLTALTGDRIVEHNRAELDGMFGGELSGPGRLHLHESLNDIRIYPWRQTSHVLPAGAVSATLADAWAGEPPVRELRRLRVGEVLVFEERLGPASGQAADADPAHRHAVRLTSVEPATDAIDDRPIVEIGWSAADALPFPLVVTGRGPAPDCAVLRDVTVAHGNVVLADHGETAPGPVGLRDRDRTIMAGPFEPPDEVVTVADPTFCCTDCGGVAQVDAAVRPYEPQVPRSPVVFAAPVRFDAPAHDALEQDPGRALPALTVFGPVTRPTAGEDTVERPVGDGPALRYERWRAHRDLLAAGPADRHLVVEVDDDRVAHLRFGDGQCGARPRPGSRMLVSYRVGGGVAGNVGADMIRHVLVRGGVSGGRIVGVRNPLPAVGGIDPEPVEQVRLRAPHAFRTRLERAVTAGDYAAIVMRDYAGRIQRAAATLAETAAGVTITVAVDPAAAGDAPPELLEEITAHLERYRRIGHRVEVTAAEYAAISLAVTVWVRPGHQPGAVRGAVLDRLGNRVLADGTLGFFHPDALTFGQPVAISRLIAAMASVGGVERADVTRLHLVADGAGLPADDVLVIEPGRIARLDNDPDRPERGSLTITTEV